ncbi:MAG: ATP-binding cassette domain-containing protein [Planctomycetota bacterium]
MFLPIIETHALTRRFGYKLAVDELTLAIESGEAFALLGPNGAGKTTTLKMLTTLLPPSTGRAAVAGFDIVRRAADVRRAIGYVPQLVSADGLLTGAENLLLFAKLYDVPRRERAARVAEALAFMGLADVGDKLVSRYSGGMIRRLEIAQSVLHRPRVLFLDEPGGGLDPVARQAVWSHIEHLRHAGNTTVFFTTHLMEEAEAACTRLALLNAGRVVAEGTPDELKRSLGVAGASLTDVFIKYSGCGSESGGTYRDALRTRSAARRRG